MTQDGQKYSDYMPALQDEFQANHFEFMENRKFPEEVSDVEKMKEVRCCLRKFSTRILSGTLLTFFFTVSGGSEREGSKGDYRRILRKLREDSDVHRL